MISFPRKKTQDSLLLRSAPDSCFLSSLDIRLAIMTWPLIDRAGQEAREMADVVSRGKLRMAWAVGHSDFQVPHSGSE